MNVAYVYHSIKVHPPRASIAHIAHNAPRIQLKSLHQAVALAHILYQLTLQGSERTMFKNGVQNLLGRLLYSRAIISAMVVVSSLFEIWSRISLKTVTRLFSFSIGVGS